MDRLKLLFCAYRNWALEIVEAFKQYEYKLIQESDKNSIAVIAETFHPDYIFFLGWSWIVESSIVERYKCICLHPSPLPLYRGGSPIQHQILNGETMSAVTLFRMDSGLDTGDIYFQESISLEGELTDIFKEIVEKGIIGINAILDGAKSYPQNHSLATTYRRRKPSASEIRSEDFSLYTAKELANKVRCLQSPYPEPFIICKDGTKLYLHKVSYE